ncbi:MAG: hypothetical protein WC476_11925 [Phycisphaerae bacterium]|jgi:hypothetical protein
MAQDNHQAEKSQLLNVSPESLKLANVDSVFVEQYKLYLESVDKLSDRRQTANSFFLTLNTAICAALGFLFSKDSANEIRCFCFIIPIAGLLISYFWSRIVSSYRQLSAGKFEVVHLMEQYLPVAPYTAEWNTLGRGKNATKYKPLTHIEVWIPRLFIIIYCILIAYLIPWDKLIEGLFFFKCQSH